MPSRTGNSAPSTSTFTIVGPGKPRSAKSPSSVTHVTVRRPIRSGGVSDREMVAPPGCSASMSSTSPAESLAAASTTSIWAKPLSSALARTAAASSDTASMAMTLPCGPTARAASREKNPMFAPTSTKTSPGCSWSTTACCTASSFRPVS